MPPRYAYWTILIDHQPTAFRAREQAELLPTLTQLRRTNNDVVLKWFSRGRLWESPDEERQATLERERSRTSATRTPQADKRDRDWRPGGQHKDPRARFRRREGPQRRGPKRRG
ncbi:MAG TPA: hypothetical protein VLV86_23040 [Vicinamibacterales bacterium]|nr:hypothetical protein [Vicinamibacterales bacterium]